MRGCKVTPPLARQSLGESALRDVAERYARGLEEKHFAAPTVAMYLSATAHFAKWLKKYRTGNRPLVRETDVREFLEVHLERCRCDRRPQRCLNTCRAALRHLVSILRDDGLYEDAPRRPLTPVDQEIELFDDYLRDVCGAARQTRLHRTRHVREFLTRVFREGAVEREQIHPDCFGRFLTIRARNCCPSTLGVITGGLRSYVRFLEFLGQCPAGLLDAVPRVARWRLASLPVHLKDDELQRFLRAFDRRSARGCRDYAMALCLTVLGLRASEVAALRLADLDWQAGTLAVSPGKTRRGRTLPLGPELGRAIVAYIKLRPQTTSSRVFVHIGAREGRPVAGTTVRSAIRLAYARAGLPTSYTGTHLLRHTAATRLVASGATVKEVADILGHASIDSTALYAKVDLARLREVALAWPEEVLP
jgi:integrase/recombinase XerD